VTRTALTRTALTGTTGGRHRGTGPRRRLAPAGLVAAVVAICVVLGPAAWAVFTDTATVTAGPTSTSAFSSGTLNAAGTPTTAQASGTAAVVVTWTAATVTSGGTGTVAPAGYDVYRATGAADAGTFVCSTTTALTCNDTAASIPSGSRYYVRARLATSWVRDSARLTYADTQPPVVTHTQPTSGASLLVGVFITAVNNSCGTGFVACGTAADTGGITATTQYRLQRPRTLGGIECWTGTAWSNTAANCGTGVFLTATGTTAWKVPGTASTAYASLGATYTLTIRSVDVAGNVAATPITFSTLL